MSNSLERLIERAEHLLNRIEAVLPRPLHAPDWSASTAFRYRQRANGMGVIEPVRQVSRLALDDLREIDDQK